MNDRTLDEQQLEALRPLAAVIEGAIKDTPIRLGTDDWGTMLAAGILVRVAAYMGGVLPPAAEPGDWLTRGTRDLSIPEQTTTPDGGECCVCGDPIEWWTGPDNAAGWVHLPNPGGLILDVHKPRPSAEGAVKRSRPVPYPSELAEDERPLREYVQAAEEDEQRTARRNSAAVLLARAVHGVLSSAEGAELRDHFNVEQREADTVRQYERAAWDATQHVLELKATIERVRERCQPVREREGPGGMINATQILRLLSPTWPDGNYEAAAPAAGPGQNGAETQ